MAQITRVESFVFRAPIAVPIKTSFGLMPNRPALFFRVEDANGAFGWGETWTNFPTVGAEYRARLFDTVIAPRLIGRDSDASPRGFWEEAERALHAIGLQTGEPGAFAAVLAGADIALNDLAARRAGVPLWRHVGGLDDSSVPIYASGLNPGPIALELVEAARAQGFRAFKIKIGFGEANDIATLKPIADTLKPGERMMIDINQGWDVETACKMAVVLRQFPLSWIEEPLPADRPAAEWNRVKAVARAPLAGGENLRGESTFQQLLAEGYLSVVQPDMCKWGGVSGTLPVARAVIAAGKTYCPHFLGAGVGLLASIHMLAAVRGPGLAEFDANPNPLREELIRGVCEVREGSASLPTGPGLGFVPDLTQFRDLRTHHAEARA